jgi:hypothetical protein
MKSIHLAVVLLGLGASTAFAGPIESACLRSDRQAASRSLCGCIQNVADAVLSYGDQRRAAGFFSNPQKAQDVRQSDRSSDEAFWLRYKAFGENAESYCTQG